MELLDYVRKYKLPDGFLDLEINMVGEWEEHTWYSAQEHDSIQEVEPNDPIVNRVIDEDVAKHFAPVYEKIIGEYQRELHQPNQSLITRISGVRMNMYKTGTSMRLHSDLIHSAFYRAPPDQRGVPILSIIGEVSTEDYRGGELYLCGRDMQMSPGDVIIFPSTFMYTHEVKPVISGTRTSFVTWAW